MAVKRKIKAKKKIFLSKNKEPLPASTIKNVTKSEDAFYDKYAKTVSER